MKPDTLLEDCKIFREFSNTLDSLHEALQRQENTSVTFIKYSQLDTRLKHRIV